MKKFPAVLAVLCAGQVACAQSTGPKDWVLTEVDGAAAAYSATLTIDGAKISGQAPCNLYTSEILGTPPAITLAPVGASRMMCEAMTEETAYLGALGATTQMVEADGTLTLTGPDHVLKFGLQVK